MSVKYNDKLPRYIKRARFIRPEAEIEESFYPRNATEYHPTQTYRGRYQRLRGIITAEDVKGCIHNGEMYPAAKGCAAFVKDLGGVVLYVVVTANLITEDGIVPRDEYDQYPEIDVDSFEHKLVTMWAYVTNRDEAWATGRWTGDQLDEIEELDPIK